MFVHQGIKHGYKIGQVELPLMIWHQGMRGKGQLNSMTMYLFNRSGIPAKSKRTAV